MMIEEIQNGGSDKFDISVVICAYTEKRWRELVAAVKSLRHQTVLPKEVILVVDHNPDLLRRVRAELPDVVAVENQEEHGLSGARNSGLEVAQGDVIAFLDDDAVAAPNWLEELAREYPDARVVGVGGASLPIWMHKQPAWFPEEFNWVVGCSYRGMPVDTSTVRNLIGCNMSFRREVFDAVGGFRNGIGRVDTRPVGCEETELCIRANQLWPDRLLLYKPDARVFHHVPANRACWRYFFARCYCEGIAKALVSRCIGAQDGLAAEWKYTLHTLPTGAMRGLADAAIGQDPSGLARAGAIGAGLAVTAAGYLAGRIR
jgi:glucosyl-dolichyl phosphate glucuronosyltransferase